MEKKNIHTVPNQNTITVHRQEIGKNFISINKTSYSKAYRDMSNSSAALGLYIWLVGNQNGYTFAFSPQAVENKLGMARSSCHGAIKKLEELGYLVQRKDGSNKYDFYEISIKDEIIERKLIDDEKIEFEDLAQTYNFAHPKHGAFEF